MRDESTRAELRCAPEVVALLPADLLDTLRGGGGARPYRCIVCGRSGTVGGDGTGADEAVSLVVRRYLTRRVRRVRFACATCQPSQVGVVADDIRAERELRAGLPIGHTDVLVPRPGERLGVPVLALDDADDLTLTDPHCLDEPDALLAGERLNPQISHGLATGLSLCTSLAVLPPTAPGWSARVVPRHIGLRHPLPVPGRRPLSVVERLSCGHSRSWRDAVRREGDTVLLLVGRIGLYSVIRPPANVAGSRSSGPPGTSRTAQARQVAARRRAVTRAVLAAMAAGQVAAGVIPVAWQDDDVRLADDLRRADGPPVGAP